MFGDIGTVSRSASYVNNALKYLFFLFSQKSVFYHLS